jgi:hypothetical protein
VTVPVVQVRVVRVSVNQRRVPVRVGVRLPRRIARRVDVLVVRVVDVGVAVRQGLVAMLVRVPLGEVQP